MRVGSVLSVGVWCVLYVGALCYVGERVECGSVCLVLGEGPLLI